MLARKGGSHFRPTVLTISTDQTSYNVFTAAGSPATAVTVYVEVASGVKVRAFDFGGAWHASAKLILTNNGYIYGAGGNGGHGQNAGGGASVAGSPGSNAITLGNIDVLIDNTYGYIFGGGGGGGGGGTPLAGSYGGGGGGGGQGVSTGGLGGTGSFPGNAGDDGTFDSLGNGGTSSAFHGGPGGAWGDWGAAGQSGGTGGAPGKAVNLNGHAVTWLGGNNGLQVRGAVA